MAQVELDREAAKRGDLPPVCAHCGDPATASRRMPFVGRTPITITAGAGAIVARLPVCDRHRWTWLLRHLPEAVAFASWIGLAVLLGNMEKAAWLAPLLPYKGALSLTALVLFLTVVVLRFVMFYTGIRMIGVSWEVLQLAGVSEQFARACYGELAESDGRDPYSSDDAVEPVLLDEVIDRGGAAVQVAKPGVAKVEYERRTAPVDAAPLNGPTQQRGTGLGIIVPLAAIAALVLLCSGGGFALWWGLSGFTGSAEPIQLSNPRTSNIAGLATHVKLDYQCAEPSRDSHYFLVVEHAGRRVSQRGGGAFSDSGSLELDVLGRHSGGFQAYVERRAAGAVSGQRVSNIVNID